MYVDWDIVNRYPNGKGRTDFMGKLNVTPNGIASGNFPGQAAQPSLTTSAIRLPIQAKRSSAWLFFSCSPMGHDFSSCLMTRDPLPESSAPSPFCPPDCAFAGPRSWINPTRRFVPPLGLLGLAEPHPELSTHMSMARYLLASQYVMQNFQNTIDHCSESDA